MGYLYSALHLYREESIHNLMKDPNTTSAQNYYSVIILDNTNIMAGQGDIKAMLGAMGLPVKVRTICAKFKGFYDHGKYRSPEMW